LARHAIWNACHALGLKPNDIVLVPAYHHGSEIEALLRADLKILYYELNEHLEPDEANLEYLINNNVRAFYLIHYLGFPQNAAYWRNWCDKRGLLLIEDAAQAFLATRDGEPIGSFGHMGVFCLYKTYGLPDGGAVISIKPSTSPSVAAKSKAWSLFKLHFYWLAEKSQFIGFAFLKIQPFLGWLRKQKKETDSEFYLGDPSTPASALTTLLLPKILNEQTAHLRRENYRYLLKHLRPLVPAPFESLPMGACPFAFPVYVDNAKLFIERLRKCGVAGILFWLYPHPSLPVENFPRSEAFREHVVALPVHQELNIGELRQIVEAVVMACK
jgi:dTDP-4-amino-4,6-dideoxygalactose transaminase